jgi:hypothetical protein
LVKNSKLEEQEKIIKPDGSSFVMTDDNNHTSHYGSQPRQK